MSCAVLFSAPYALGTPITAGTTLHAVGENDPTGGTLVSGTGLPVAFSSDTFDGTLTSSVITGDPSNPYGGLTFTYLLSNDSMSLDQMERLTVNGFAGFLTDISYQIPASGVIPDTNDRSLSGNTVGFSFNGPPLSLLGAILPGQSSSLLVVQTNATLYRSVTANVIDGSVSSVPSFGPRVVVPEPSSMVLAALGLASVVMVALRKRRAK